MSKGVLNGMFEFVPKITGSNFSVWLWVQMWNVVYTVLQGNNYFDWQMILSIFVFCFRRKLNSCLVVFNAFFWSQVFERKMFNPVRESFSLDTFYCKQTLVSSGRSYLVVTLLNPRLQVGILGPLNSARVCLLRFGGRLVLASKLLASRFSYTS